MNVNLCQSGAHCSVDTAAVRRNKVKISARDNDRLLNPVSCRLPRLCSTLVVGTGILEILAETAIGRFNGKWFP